MERIRRDKLSRRRRRQVRSPRPWRGWHLDGSVLVLRTPAAGYEYEIDLERCRSCAEVLDWIMQVAGKTWADDDVLAGLIRALRDTLHPQATLCSTGIDQGRLERAEIRDMVTSRLGSPVAIRPGGKGTLR